LVGRCQRRSDPRRLALDRVQGASHSRAMECPRIFRRFLVGFPYGGSEIRAGIRVEARKNHVSFFSSFASAGPKFVRPLIQKRVGQFYKRRRGKACEARARRNAHRFLLRTFRGRISALSSTRSPILPALSQRCSASKSG
jgi:hypothetical protein